MRFLWYPFQIAVFFGALYFFIDVAPSEASLGAKTLVSGLLAYGATIAISKALLLAHRLKQRIRQARNSERFLDGFRRLPD